MTVKVYFGDSMSERGSFVTQFIYCDKCLEAAKEVLLGSHKSLCSQQIKGWSGNEDDYMPIIAGKIGGTYSGEEINDFEESYIPMLEAKICHELRISVLTDVADYDLNFIVKPKAQAKEDK